MREALFFSPLFIRESERIMSSELVHNTYYEGLVQSIGFTRNGLKATVGVIASGRHHFGTAAAERMEIVAGDCRVKIDGAADWKNFGAGEFFDVPANSGFDIEVSAGICEYVCSFLS